MEIQKYFDDKKEIYDDVLLFLDSLESENFLNENFTSLINNINIQKIEDDKEELEHLIDLLVNISNHHHRGQGFFEKVEQILQHIKHAIQRNLTNIEIYSHFENNKRLLLFIINEGIIAINDIFVKKIENKFEKNGMGYSDYFKPEIEQYNRTQTKHTIKEKEHICNLDKLEFNKKRIEGENDSYICLLIRQDSVEEFISYVNQKNISFSSTIKPSIFETNTFLNSHETTPIEYATFFGSIQIFQYLFNNNAKINNSIWFYAIHSNDAEIINFLEENLIKPNDETIEEIYKESIKCHHNNIARFIESNYLEINKSNIDESIIEISFHYSNYYYFPSNFDQNIVFYCLCVNNYLKIVNHLLDNKKEYFESKII